MQTPRFDTFAEIGFVFTMNALDSTSARISLISKLKYWDEGKLFFTLVREAAADLVVDVQLS